MISPQDEQFLRRALRVAMNGRGRVEPNPMVGCVLVKDGQIIAEGHHTHFGGPHAEPTALADCIARGNDPRGATAYVTLEPCCHTNKKTPPCAPRLIEAGIARVVIGCVDPNPDVDGKGVAMLRTAGIQVESAPPELAAVFKQLIAPFRSMFYTTLKWAESADGFVAGAGGMPVRITGPEANLAVHRLRTRCDAILVSSRTVEMDDPALTVRGVDVLRRPTRIILDRSLRTSPSCRLLTEAGPTVTGQPVVILTDFEQFKMPNLAGQPDEDGIVELPKADLVVPLRKAGARVIGVTGDELQFALSVAKIIPIGGHLMIEPGPRLAAETLPWADRLWVFRSAEALDAGESAPTASPIPDTYLETGRLRIGHDTLIEYLNTKAESFVTATPSADFVLESERVIAQA
jgi:diaminohydroxyphosphoribosylaminopyrimidine deaminase/5-amino-6-(5-phosphoribosylamino)uracil reductase